MITVTISFGPPCQQPDQRRRDDPEDEPDVGDVVGDERQQPPRHRQRYPQQSPARSSPARPRSARTSWSTTKYDRVPRAKSPSAAWISGRSAATDSSRSPTPSASTLRNSSSARSRTRSSTPARLRWPASPRPARRSSPSSPNSQRCFSCSGPTSIRPSCPVERAAAARRPCSRTAALRRQPGDRDDHDRAPSPA